MENIHIIATVTHNNSKYTHIHTVQCVHNRPAYFADRLYHSMKGLGTDDDTLMRVVVTRCEVCGAFDLPYTILYK